MCLSRNSTCDSSLKIVTWLPWENFEILIICVGASRSFPLPRAYNHYHPYLLCAPVEAQLLHSLKLLYHMHNKVYTNCSSIKLLGGLATYTQLPKLSYTHLEETRNWLRRECQTSTPEGLSAVVGWCGSQILNHCHGLVLWTLEILPLPAVICSVANSVAILRLDAGLFNPGSSVQHGWSLQTKFPPCVSVDKQTAPKHWAIRERNSVLQKRQRYKLLNSYVVITVGLEIFED